MNPGLDLSKLKSTEVRFAGSFVAAGFNKLPDDEEDSGSTEVSGVEEDGEPTEETDEDSQPSPGGNG